METIQEEKLGNNKKDTISYVKGTYIWKTEEAEVYNSRMKIIKSINNNIKLPLVNIYENKEYILKPRCIVNDPFTKENSLLIWCDIIDFDAKCYSSDSRITFLQQIKECNEIIKVKTPRISFIQKFEITSTKNKELDYELLLNDFINLCLGCNIEIDEFQIKNNVIEIQNNLTQILSSCDDLLLIRFLFYKLSLINKFKYKLCDKLKYKFCDIDSQSDNGYETIIQYATKLGQVHNNIKKEKLHKDFKDKSFSFGQSSSNMIVIPESVKKSKNGFFIDQRFISLSDPYAIIYNSIKLLYTTPKNSDI